MKRDIQLQTLKGFKDYFTDDIKLRDFVRDTFRNLAKEFAFEPLETPALEYSELILGQSGEEAEKLYYRFKDNADRDVMLKYELMTSMCRAVAQNINNITFPYKRYQIQNVWRADNVQRGRLREFTQMDVDILGSSSYIADAEILQFGLEFLERLGFKEYLVRINSREIIQGILEALSIDLSKFEDVYIAIDKLQKIGVEGVKEEMIRKGTEEKDVEKIIDIITTNDIKKLEKLFSNSETGKRGLENVQNILQLLNDLGIEEKFVKFDLTLARGLASYTGAVWEYEIVDDNIGSVSGGGRYDKAIEKYTGTEIPATGTSFGLERLTEVLKGRDILKSKLPEKKEVLIIPLDKENVVYATNFAKELRKEGIIANTYPDIKKLKVSLKYADKKGIPWVVIIGENEVKENKVLLKNMNEQEQNLLDTKEAINKILE